MVIFHSYVTLPEGKALLINSMAISGTDCLEVHTKYEAYFSGLCKEIYPENMAIYGTVPPI